MTRQTVLGRAAGYLTRMVRAHQLAAQVREEKRVTDLIAQLRDGAAPQARAACLAATPVEGPLTVEETRLREFVDWQFRQVDCLDRQSVRAAALTRAARQAGISGDIEQELERRATNPRHGEIPLRFWSSWGDLWHAWSYPKIGRDKYLEYRFVGGPWGDTWWGSYMHLPATLPLGHCAPSPDGDGILLRLRPTDHEGRERYIPAPDAGLPYTEMVWRHPTETDLAERNGYVHPDDELDTP